METQLPVIFLTFANDKVDDALYLRNLPKELNAIRNALEKAERANLCEVIERTACTVEDIFDTFQDERYADRIAMFHYGGHASGSQLMLETLDGGHGVAHADGLISFLGKQKGLQMVFFNGCSSQEQALQLSEAGVPAVIGTATAIKDEIATELAGRFYNSMASGATINNSWLEAIDIVKTKTNTTKRKGLKLRRDKSSDFPWNLYIRDGAEVVRDWDLPSVSKNPLFGLPELPVANLPEEPFRFLRRYEPHHAEIFFGRDKYIRQLYDRITSDKSSPVILFYGQSGAGKSSALASGLLPRLEQEADVKYIRRDTTIGLLGCLDEALGGNFQRSVLSNSEGEAIMVSDVKAQIEQMEQLKKSIDVAEHGTLNKLIEQLQNKLNDQNMEVETENRVGRLERWLSIEEETGRPFNILLDQVEEVFTRPNLEIPNELEYFLLEIQQIFAEAGQCPKGNIILSYRKEYHPEIDEFCKKLQIPREGIFLKRLETEDIEEVVRGVESTERLSNRYKIMVEPDLPNIIADDLMEDKDSPIAPVLSILLTKMWELSQKQETTVFSVAQYQILKTEGILMDDFYHQQMGKLSEWNKDVVESGLALDILNIHTTELGTAGICTETDIKERYKHQGVILDDLLDKLQNLYLLADAGQDQTSLAHDTIAPIVSKELRNSDKDGQRAFRILISKANEFKADKTNLLDSADLAIIENGKNGMRLWNETEKELILLSQKQRAKRKALRRNLMITGAVVMVIIIVQSIFSFFQVKSVQSNAYELEGLLALGNKDYTTAYDFAEKSLDVKSSNTKAQELLIKSRYANLYNSDYQYYFTPYRIKLLTFGAKDNYFTGSINDAHQPIHFNYNRYSNTTGNVLIGDINGEEVYTGFDTTGQKVIDLKVSSNFKLAATMFDNASTEDSLFIDFEVKDIIQNQVQYETRQAFSQSLLQFRGNLTKVYRNFRIAPSNDALFYYAPSVIEKEILTEEANSYQIIDTIKVINANKTICHVFVDSVEMVRLTDYSHIKFSGIIRSISEDGKYLITSEGIIYDLTRDGAVHFDYGEKSTPSFIENGEKIVLTSSSTGVKVYSNLTKELVFERPSQENVRSYTLTADSKYIVLQLDKERFEVLNAAVDTVVLAGEGIFQGYFERDSLFFAVQSPNTTLVYRALPDGTLDKRKYDGRFKRVLPNGMLFVTDNGIFPNELTSAYRLPTIAESQKRQPPLANLVFYEDGFTEQLYNLLGGFVAVSEDGRYILTKKGFYDVEPNSPTVFSSTIAPKAELTPLYFISEDGKYLIEERGDDFSMENILTGDTLNTKKTQKYQPKWEKYKSEVYENKLKKLYDFVKDNNQIRPIFKENERIKFKTLDDRLWIEHQFYQVYVKDENEQTLALWTAPINHYIISVTPKVNGHFLEIIYAGTETDTLGNTTRKVQTLLWDLDKSRIVGKD